MIKQEEAPILSAIERQEKKQLKLQARQLYRPGHTLWQFDAANMVLSKAAYSATTDYKTKAVKRTVITQEGCYYFQALNLKNAIKYLSKAGLQPGNYTIEK